MIDTPESIDKDFSSTVELSVNTRRRLEKLTQWRINPDLLEFPEDAPKFEGGYAIVSKALLGPSVDVARDQMMESSCNNLESTDCMAMLESGTGAQEAHGRREEAKGKEAAEKEERESCGETSGQLKVVAVKRMKMGTKTPVEVVRVLGLTLREAELLVGLSHENVTKLEGFVEDVSKGVVWLVFPWEDNGTLRDFVASHNWEIPERISLINDVTKGVEYLHSREPPIVHGDLKSINVLVNSTCRAKISDFGSAHHSVAKSHMKENSREPAIEEPQPAPSLEAAYCHSTSTITLTCGPYTLRWAAPELLREGHADVASDIWALGCVAYEVMTNSIPFQGVKEDVTVILHVVRGDLPFISGDAWMLLIQALCSLPMIIPNPRRTADATEFGASSARLLIELGQMHREQCDYPNASKYYAQAVGIYEEIADSEGKAMALYQHAMVYALQGQDDQATASYSEALKIYTEMGHGQGRASAVLGIASMHLRRNEGSRAATAYSECLKISTEIGHKEGRANALWGLASVHRLQSEYSQAIARFSEGLEICIDMRDQEGRANALLGLGSVYYLQGEYGRAVELYWKVVEVRSDVGDREGRAEALYILAEVYRIQNDYDQAITLYSECQQIFTDIGDREGIANALWSLAAVYQLRSEYSQAGALYSECLQIRTDIGHRRGRADAFWGLGSVHRLQGEYSQATKFYSECLQIRTEMGDAGGRAEALLLLGDVHRAQMKYHQAVEFYSECLQVRTDTGDRGGGVDPILGLAEVHRVQKEYSQAMTRFSEALTICTDMGNQSQRPFTLLGLANTHRDQGQHSDAIHYYERAAESYMQIGQIAMAVCVSDQASSIRRLLRQEEVSWCCVGALGVGWLLLHAAVGRWLGWRM